MKLSVRPPIARSPMSNGIEAAAAGICSRSSPGYRASHSSREPMTTGTFLMTASPIGVFVSNGKLRQRSITPSSCPRQATVSRDSPSGERSTTAPRDASNAVSVCSANASAIAATSVVFDRAAVIA